MRNVLIKFPAGKRKPTYLIPTLTHRLTLISKDAFEDAFLVNKIVIDSPCLIHPQCLCWNPKPEAGSLYKWWFRILFCR